MKKHLTFAKQQGVALITVMVILLLSIVAVLAATRTGLLNEALVGNMSDYSRALAAAEALIRDAEIDVRGRLPNGYLCREVVPGSDVPTAGFIGCRSAGTGDPYFPETGAEFDDARDRVLITFAAPAATPCIQGICFPASVATLANFEDNPGTMAAMAAQGVRYGAQSFNGTPLGPATNPILSGVPVPASATAPTQGWYWVEVFQYDKHAPINRPGEVTPGGPLPLIFRITAIAMGQKVGTRAIVRSFFVTKPKCGGTEPCTTGL